MKVQKGNNLGNRPEYHLKVSKRVCRELFSVVQHFIVDYDRYVVKRDLTSLSFIIKKEQYRRDILGEKVFHHNPYFVSGTPEHMELVKWGRGSSVRDVHFNIRQRDHRLYVEMILENKDFHKDKVFLWVYGIPEHLSDGLRFVRED